MKSLKLGDTVWADGYKATVYSLPNLDGDMQIILDEGFWTETIYDCNIHDISLDSDGEWELTTEFVPIIGDVIRIDDEEYELITIDEGVVTIQRGDELRYYRLFDVEHNIIEGYWISSICEQVFSPTVMRKLEVYEVQDNVYSYNSLDELKEIYELLGEPYLYGVDGYTMYDLLIEGLQCNYGLIYFWENYDNEWIRTYKNMKVIQGGCIKDSEQCTH